MISYKGFSTAPKLLLVICSIATLLVLPNCETTPSQELTIKQLDPDSAAMQAQAIRDQVSAQVADGLELTLWASDSLVADPIAIDIDHQGRIYYTRSIRHKHSEFDIRGHMDWATESISLTTPEERRQFLRKIFAPENSEQNEWLADLNADGVHDWQDLAVEKERVYRVEDRSGDGVADFSQLYIEDFHDENTDVAGALLVREDDVFLGVGPDMWRLEDRSGNGMADFKESISHGYSVHVGFGGHNMSGAIQGPDGRIYWGVGDIGMNVTAPDGKQWAYPNQGAIVRANPDGSDFEVFAAGLRNTHEFVFDEYGNIFSVDNDGDHPGESERMVHIVNGSDAGWRTNWQFGKYTDPDNNNYKVWMEEGLYKPRFEGQAAYIIPPIRNYHNGPTGMVYNPGTALGPKWNNHFFVAEFVGTPARAAIWAFRVQPKGATYDFLDEEKVLGGVLATGLDFGPDGALYLADWIEGWETNDQGRIWKLDLPSGPSDLRKETEALIGQSFKKKNNDELLGLLQHQDMRVRSKAQFALVGKGSSGGETLLQATEQRDHQLAQIHGIWGIGQLARKDMSQAASLLPLLQDEDPEIRAQVAKIVGDIRYEEAGDDLVPLLKDASGRVQFYAAEALGRVEHESAIQPLLAMLEANNDQDHYLRHAGILALSRIGASEAVLDLVDHELASMRTAAVLVLRRLKHPGVAKFLKDESEYIVTEAARAINDDLSIIEALPELAAVLKEERFTNEALVRRAINACLRVGGEDELNLLTAYANRSSAPEALRVEAISTLGGWAKPSVLDRVDGRNRGVIERDPAPAQLAASPLIQGLMSDGSQGVQVAAVAAAGKLRIQAAAPMIANLVSKSKHSQVRMAALQSLQHLAYGEIGTVVQQALIDNDEKVRMMALSMIPELGLADDQVAQMLPSVLAKGSAIERQTAVQVLGKLSGSGSQNILEGLMDELVANKLPGEIHLDLIEVAEQTTSESLKAKLATYQASNPETNYQGALWGGDSLKGIQVFARNQSAQCLRCHAIGPYGGEVGPRLDNIGNRYTREEILESVVDPSARITPGYGIVSLTLNDGETASGILLKESDTSLTLQINDEEREIIKTDIGERTDAPSSMPGMGNVLSMRELRDLVEFLSRIKQEPDAGDQRLDN